MRLIPFFVFLCLGLPLYACCPTDKDTLADEMGSVAVLDVIAGRIDRQVPAYYEAKLDALAGSNEVGDILQGARYLDMLDRQAEALRIIQDLRGRELTADQNFRVHALELQLGMHLWWRGGADEYTSSACVDIARRGYVGQPPNQAIALILDWMQDETPADPSRMWRDMLGLRIVPNKTSAEPTGQLEPRGLTGADKLLLDLVRAHPCWENFDTFYTLSLVYAVQGRQNLAHYTQQRMWQILDQGGTSRVPLDQLFDDIRPNCVVRQSRAGSLIAVTLVTEENKSDIIRQFSARSSYADTLRKARENYARERIENGADPVAADFWGRFKMPSSDVPAPGTHATATVSSDASDGGESAASESGEKEGAAEASHDGAAREDAQAEEKNRDRTTTWITLGVLVAILLLGGVAKVRIDRSARRVLDEPEPATEPKEDETS